jgi:hypothetical protein
VAELRVKTGVQPKLLVIVAAVANEARRLTAPPLVYLTSGLDGTHADWSKHYQLGALDVRSQNFPSPASKREFRRRLQARLGARYRVILEGEGTANEHFHIQIV